MLKHILCLIFILGSVNSQDACGSTGQFCSNDCTKYLSCDVKDYGELSDSSIIKDCSTSNGYCNYLSISNCVAKNNETGLVGTCALSSSSANDYVECAGWKRMPHPTDCTKFINCSDPENPIVDSCSCSNMTLPSNSFDPESGLCNLSMTNGICGEGLTPICRKILENKSGQVKCNPSIYWTCTTNERGYFMKLKACPNGKQFDTRKNTCVESYIDGPFCLNGNELKSQDNAFMYR